MVKALPSANVEGIYSATYSNIPVYEFQFGEDLKEHVMRRRGDDWINATHILKAAGQDKPSRTRTLERDVQKLPQYEKIQGGYGKYQGTWIPLASGADLARRQGVYEKLRPIFEYRPGDHSPPPAPKHTTNKPRVPKKPAVPKFNMAAPTPMREASYDDASAQMNDDETPDDTTIASQSYMEDPEEYHMPQSQQSTGNRKRKRNTVTEPTRSVSEQQHVLFNDELLDYFMVSQGAGARSGPFTHPEPPPNYQPNLPIDTEGHTALSWACAMGDVEVMHKLLRFGARIDARNQRQETPLMRTVLFTNCFDRNTFSEIVKELFTTVRLVDACGSNVLQHAAALTCSKSKHHVARYYIDVLLNMLDDNYDADEVQKFIDHRDMDGNTAIHLAARNKARKCVRALLGRHASVDIPNHDGITAETLIANLNSTRSRRQQGSSSPYAPNHARMDIPQPATQVSRSGRAPVAHHSEAAMTIETKITPSMTEKLRELAKSFDDELIDVDASEREARRILKTTQDDVKAVQEQIQALLRQEEEEDADMDDLPDTLPRDEAELVSLVEQIQHYNFQTLSKREESQAGPTMNGTHPQIPEEALAGKNELAVRLACEKERRKHLIEAFADVKSKTVGGEKGIEFIQLVAKCVNKEVGSADLEDCVDELLECLEVDREDELRETVDGRTY